MAKELVRCVNAATLLVIVLFAPTPLMSGPTFFENLSQFLGLSEGSSVSATPAAASSGTAAMPMEVPRPSPKPLTPQDAMIQKLTEGVKEANREFSRTLNRMKRAEDDKIRAIREAAERGRKGDAMRLARDMVASRRAQRRIERAVEKMSRMQDRMQVLRATSTIALVFKQSLHIMEAMNKFMNPARIQALAQTMAEESAKLGLTQEAMDDALNELDEADADAFGDEDDAEGMDDALSESAIVEQIFAECHLTMADMMPGVPSGPVTGPSVATSSSTTMSRQPLAVAEGGAPTKDAADDDLVARLAKLNARK